MNEMVTISKEEYQRLLSASDDLQDIKTIEEYRKKLDSNEEERLPPEFVSRMLDGESLLKLWREHRDLSQNKLSELSGVNRVQIINIESKKNTGSVVTLKKLADALSISIDDLVE